MRRLWLVQAHWCQEVGVGQRRNAVWVARAACCFACAGAVISIEEAVLPAFQLVPAMVEAS